MAIKTIHDTTEKTWFVTFTCYRWIPLFDITNSYDLIYNWFRILRERSQAHVIAFVIMPNHVHCILELAEETSLNKLIANAKRFIAYEMIQRLHTIGREGVLTTLNDACSIKERSKGQKHKVFEPSFDAKSIFTDPFLHQKINYIHFNPISGKWNLADEFTDYYHSSAGFYEKNIGHPEVDIKHYHLIEG
jgi:putative transposase